MQQRSERMKLFNLLVVLLVQIYNNNVVKATNSAGCLNNTFLVELSNLMQNITTHAFKTMKDEKIFLHMGHIGEVVNEMHDFAMAAMTPGIKTICEVGFNAGSLHAYILKIEDCLYITGGLKL